MSVSFTAFYASVRLRGRGRHVQTTVANWCYRITSAVVQIIGMRLLLMTLGQDRYGVVVILSGILPVFTVFDFGLGNSAQNIISAARAQQRDYGATLRTVLFILGTLSVGLTAFVWCLSPFVAPGLLRSAAFISPITACFLVGLAGSLFATQTAFLVVVKVYYAEHRGYIANYVLSGASLASMVSIALIAAGRWTSVGLALCALYLPTSVALLALAVPLFRRLRSVQRMFSIGQETRLLFSKGMRFGALGLGSLVINRIEFVVLGQVCALQDVVSYKILSSICMFIFMFYSSAQQAIWPICAENAVTHCEADSERRAYRLIFAGWAFAAVAIAGFILMKSLILGFLSPRQPIHLADSSVLLYGCYISVRIWSDTFAMLMQSANRFRLLIGLSMPAGMVGLSAQIFFGKTWGINGLIVGLIIPYTLVFCVPLWLGWRRFRAAAARSSVMLEGAPGVPLTNQSC